MKKIHLPFAILLAVVMSLIIILAWGCYSWVGEEPFICLPLTLPVFPFVWIADLFRIDYDGPTNWPVIILGSFFTWLILGLLLKNVIISIKNQKIVNLK